MTKQEGIYALKAAEYINRLNQVTKNMVVDSIDGLTDDDLIKHADSITELVHKWFPHTNPGGR